MHPVVAVPRARRDRGDRQDGHRVALVLEGGGMRGVVSSAMADELERDGLDGAFDLVVATSAAPSTAPPSWPAWSRGAPPPTGRRRVTG